MKKIKIYLKKEKNKNKMIKIHKKILNNYNNNNKIQLIVQIKENEMQIKKKKTILNMENSLRMNYKFL